MTPCLSIHNHEEDLHFACFSIATLSRSAQK
jgi:hypothetical protein